MVTKTCTRNSAIGPCYNIQRLIIGPCYLMEIRDWPQAPQYYIFLILWVKLIWFPEVCLPWPVSIVPTARGTLYPTSAPSSLLYQCSNHPSVKKQSQKLWNRQEWVWRDSWISFLEMGKTVKIFLSHLNRHQGCLQEDTIWRLKWRGGHSLQPPVNSFAWSSSHSLAWSFSLSTLVDLESPWILWVCFQKGLTDMGCSMWLSPFQDLRS